MKHLFPIYGMCSILWLGACTPVATQPEKSLFTTQEDFPNLLNVKNVPEQPVDGDLNLFSDLGAWSGYALPVNQSRAFAGAFIGPMTMHGRGWIAQTLAQPTLVVNGEKYDLVRNMQTAKYLPGRAGTDGRAEITDQIGLPAEMPGKFLRPGSEENMITHGMIGLQFGPARPVRDIKTQGA